jgi:hypothetical protein
MTIKRLVSCVAVTLAVALPTAANAQTQVAPPAGDNYLCPVGLSDFNDPGRFPSQEIGFIADTTSYSVQTDLFNPRDCGTTPGSGGPREPTGCGNASYGNTIWAVFYSDRWGVMNIETAGPFDSVIGVIPFESPASDPTPNINSGACYDRLRGFSEEAAGLVAPRQWYAVQVGGTGAPQGGQVQVKFNLDPPPSVDGQAFLFWKKPPLRISDMYVKKVPSGETLELRCTKRACKKKTVKVGGKRVLAKSWRSDWKPGPSAAGVHMKGAVDGPSSRSNPVPFKALVHEAAKKVRLLKNRKVKAGAKIELRIKRTGFIGKYYKWKVGKGSISSATQRCLNPGSNKPHKKCHG